MHQKTPGQEAQTAAAQAGGPIGIFCLFWSKTRLVNASFAQEKQNDVPYIEKWNDLVHFIAKKVDRIDTFLHISPVPPFSRRLPGKKIVQSGLFL